MQTKILNGIDGLKEVFNSTLVNQEGLLRTALSDSPLIYLIGDKFSKEYTQQRVEKKIHLRSLRFSKELVDKKEDTDYKRLDKEVRVASFVIPVSFIIWEDNVVVVHTTKEMLSHWVIDQDYADSIKSWYDLVWEHSKQ